MKTQIKKYVSLILAVMMCMSILPAQAFAAADGSNVVISQAYGGGGNSGAVYKNDFIELYNPTNKAISLDGWSVQYASATGTSWQVTNLSGTIGASSYYLIKQAAGSGGTEDLPAPDATGSIAMAGTGFKIALVSNTTPLSGAGDPKASGVVDFVGAGSANAYEGAKAAAPSNTASIIRINNQDTDDNSKDFTTSTPPTPRNSSYGGSTAPVATKAAKPTSTIPSGPVVIGTTIGLSCTTPNTEIYYTTDNTTPNIASKKFSSANPIEITGDVEIKAVAVDKSGVLDDSEVAEFKYTILEKSDISAIRSGGTNKTVMAEGVVAADYNASAMKSLGCYIQDNTGGILLYNGTDGTIGGLSSAKTGDMLRIAGSTAEYNGKFEIVNIIYAQTIGTSSVEAKEITAADAATAADAEKYEGRLIKLTGLNVDKIETDSYQTSVFTLSKDGFTITAKLDNRRDTGISASVNDTVSITGIIESNGDNTKHLIQLRTKNDMVVTKQADKVASPIASPFSGVKVTSGTKITFTCGTPDAVIKYSLSNPSDGTAAWVNVPAGGYEITGEPNTKVKLYVKATKALLSDSDVVELEYEIKAKSAATDPIPDDSFPPDAKNLKEAIALPNETKNVTVIGQLAYRYGNCDNTNTAVLQDVINGEIVALQVYNALNSFNIGDIIKVTGTRSSYGGVPQMAAVTATLATSAGNTSQISPQEFSSITEMLAQKDNLISEVVLLKNVTLGAYNVSNNTKITDSEGKSINIYQAAAYPQGVAEGDKVNLLAVLSKYSSSSGTTDQLRVGSPQSNAGKAVYDVANDTKPPVITLADKFLNAKVGADYLIEADVKDNKGIESVLISYTIGETAKNAAMVKNNATGKYEFTVPAAEITEKNTSISFIITATDASGLISLSEKRTVNIENMPRIVKVTPAANSATGANKKPEFTVSFENAGEAPAVALTLTLNSQNILSNQAMAVSGTKAVFTPAANLADGKYSATAVITRADSAKAEYKWTFYVGESKFSAFFGQLHSHTAEYSDGSGTLNDGLNYIQKLNSSDNVQFVAFTDHSNYFDTTSAANPPAALKDTSLATKESLDKWKKYTGTMREFNKNNNKVLAIPGFEMTWSGGPGHINTFNTPGVVSRNDKTLNNKTNNAGLQAYYNLLKTVPESVSQFNHPGTTFGTFADFSYYDQEIDKYISLIEVGNGEGAIGSSGYFPSYEYYIQALDKGWHLAPTNNQDNHKGNWGNSNNARSVILTDDFSEAGLINGMRNMTMYSTEDKNLEINYAVNDCIMGSVISEVPKKLNITASINDPDNESIGTVEVVVNGGRVIYQKKFNTDSAEINIDAAPEYTYYFLRVIQADKDIAVTAPVWVGEVPKVGITGIATDTIMPVKGEKINFKTKLYNSESSALNIEKIEYSETYSGSTEVIKTITNTDTVPPKTSEKIYELDYTPSKVGFTTISVKIWAKLGDTPYNFEAKKEIEVLDPNDIVPIAIDGGHSNFYVTGNYPDSDAGLIEMCSRNGIRAVRLAKGELTYEKLKDKKLLVLTVPFVSFGTAVTDYLYTDAEIAAIKQYASNGGNVIVCSKSDRGDPTGAGEQANVISNKILEAIGAKARVAEGIVVDADRASNESYRITLGGETEEDRKVFNYSAMPYDNLAASLLKDVKETTNNTFSAYNSAPIIANGTTPIVKGFATTWATKYADLKGSADKYKPKDDARVVAQKGDANLITAERLPGGGFAVISGVTFFSTFEVKVELDNASQKQNSNYQLVQNILELIKPQEKISDIADVHKSEEGKRFVIEGIATSNASGYDTQTAFFDCIYVQDSTGGINVFPVSSNIQAGQRVRITGYGSSYLGERQLNAKSTEIIDSNISALPQPKAITTKQASEGAYFGSLVKISGKVISFTSPNNVVETIIVRDSSGADARVFIDGYITSAKIIDKLAVGANITATGLSSHDTLGSRIRIRDRADIICSTAENNGGNNASNGNDSSGSENEPATESSSAPAASAPAVQYGGGSSESSSHTAALSNPAASNSSSSSSHSTAQIGKTIKDAATGVLFVLTDAKLPDGILSDAVKPAVQQLNNESEKAQAVKNILSANENLKDWSGLQLYELDLTAMGKKVEFTGKVTVTLPRPKNSSEFLHVFYVAENGALIDMNARVMSDVVEFETDHFSTYAIIDFKKDVGKINGEISTNQDNKASSSSIAAKQQTQAANTNAAAKSSSKNNIVVVAAGIFCVLCLACIIYVVVFRKRKA